MSGTTPYRILGKGTYGVVIQPALPNGTETFPTNVTKIFTSKTDYISALQQIKNAKNIGLLAIKAEPYNNRFTIASLGDVSLDPSIISTIHEHAKNTLWQSIQVPELEFNNMKAQIAESVKDEPNKYIQKYTYDKELTTEINKYKLNITSTNINTNYEIYPLRLDYLGESFDNIEIKYSNLYNIDYKILLQQILKSFKAVKAIWTAGYIHGDIRSSNVLCQLKNGFSVSQGTITIIDFDFLYKKDIFLNKYPTFFFSHPPEALLVWGRDNKLPSLLSSKFDKKSENDLKEIVRNQLVKIRGSDDIYNIDNATTSLTRIIIDSRSICDADLRHAYVFNTYLAKYIDSYGLASAFEESFGKAWHFSNRKHIIQSMIMGTQTDMDYYKFTAMRESLMFIFDSLLKSDINLRKDIEWAITTFEQSLKENGLLVLDIPVDEISHELKRLALIATVFKQDPLAIHNIFVDVDDLNTIDTL